LVHYLRSIDAESLGINMLAGLSIDT
jgi:hypothetical protein